MGVRVNTIFEHKLADTYDTEHVIQLLGKTTAAAVTLATIQTDIDAGLSQAQADHWTTFPESPFSGTTKYLVYNGPGLLSIRFGDRTGRIRAGSRWRSFLEIPSLRLAHIHAFRTIALAFGSQHFACYPDDDAIDDAVFSKRFYFNDCIAYLNSKKGPPSPIEPNLEKINQHRSSELWFVY